MTSAGDTRTAGYTGALRTASPTLPSKSLTQEGGRPFPGPFPSPSILQLSISGVSAVESWPMPFMALREQIAAYLKTGTAHPSLIQPPKQEERRCEALRNGAFCLVWKP